MVAGPLTDDVRDVLGVSLERLAAEAPLEPGADRPCTPCAPRAWPRTATSASFAGLHDTELGVADDGVEAAVLRCWASLWSDRAIDYRSRRDLPPDGGSMAVVVQALVPADAAAVVFTRHPVTGRSDVLLINAVRGLGEAMVSGTVTPHSIVMDKATGIRPRVEAGDQAAGAPLEDAVVADLAALCLEVEAAFGAPMDIEAAHASGHLVSAPGATDHRVRDACVTDAGEFPVAWRDPSDAELSWEWDDMHMPAALTALAADWVQTIGVGFRVRQRAIRRPDRDQDSGLERLRLFRARHRSAGDRNVRRCGHAERRLRGPRSPSPRRTGKWSRSRKIRDIYAWIAVPAGGNHAGRGARRDVGRSRGSGSGDAGPSTSTRSAGRTRSSRTSPTSTRRSSTTRRRARHGVDRGRHRRAAGRGACSSRTSPAQLASTPGLVELLADCSDGRRPDRPSWRHPRVPGRSSRAWRRSSPNTAISARASTTWCSPSWGEEPGLLLAELAKRVERPATIGAEERRARTRCQGGRAGRARAGQASPSDTEKLRRFDDLLTAARRIGPLTETHNYWIDRMAQASMRRFVLRVGRRLVYAGSIDGSGRHLPSPSRRGRRASSGTPRIDATSSTRANATSRGGPRPDRRRSWARPPRMAKATGSTARGFPRRAGRAARYRRVGGGRSWTGAGDAHAGRLRARPARGHHRLPVIEPVVGAALRDRRRTHHQYRRRPLARRRRGARVRAARRGRDRRRDDHDRGRAAGRARRQQRVGAPPVTAPGRARLLSPAMLGVASGAVLVPLNSTMLAVALPSIIDEFGIDPATVSTLVTLYLGAVTVALPASGSLGDRFGHRRVFLVGVVAFASVVVTRRGRAVVRVAGPGACPAGVERRTGLDDVGRARPCHVAARSARRGLRDLRHAGVDERRDRPVHRRRAGRAVRLAVAVRDRGAGRAVRRPPGRCGRAAGP